MKIDKNENARQGKITSKTQALFPKENGVSEKSNKKKTQQKNVFLSKIWVTLN